MKKLYSIISAGLVFVMVLTGCGVSEQITIQRPEDGWYGAAEHQSVSYETIRGHTFDESKLLSSLEELSQTIREDGSEEWVLALYQTILSETDSLGTAMTLADIEYNANVQDEAASEKRIALTEQYHRLMDQIYPILKDALAPPYGGALEAEMLKVTTQDEIDQIKNYKVKSEEELALILREQELTQQYDLTMQQEFEVTVDGEKWTAEKLQTSPPDDMTQNYKINKALQDARTEAIGELLRELLQVRTELAKAQGYDNYSDYAYKELYNRDYTVKDIEKVYASVKKYFVPFYKQVQDSSAEIDWSILSNSKKESEEELLQRLAPYMEKIDPELAQSFDLLRESGTYDMANKKGKNSFSFATKLYSYDIPFLFLSPVGYAQDSTVLIHEFGHWNTMLHSKQPMLFEGKNHDVAEINSQGLELLFLEYADEMWGEGADAIRYNTIMKLCSSVIEGCLYDEFQNALYANPDMTTDEMSELYQKLCKEYGLTGKGQDDWIYVAHTFSFPLYYISYATSGLSSLDLYTETFENREQAVNRYMALSAIGMTGSYCDSIQKVGLKDIFDAGSVNAIVKGLKTAMDLK